ncbi:MAG TPA: hypothetical protein VJX92_25575 [Methylomirabilota bacterium]|nr:hypothetical protein [Methylomirabilota bacterium]
MKRILGIALVGAAAVVAVTWVLERVMPPPYSGYLALCLVGLTVTTIFKRRPSERAVRWLRWYFRARTRGDEDAARQRLLTRSKSGPELRRQVEAAWRGASEKDRVLAGVTVLLAGHGKRLDAVTLGAAYDRVRDKFTIAGWSTLPAEFVREVRGRLEDREQRQLDALADRYALFRQRFFQRPSSLAADPGASVHDFARLLASVGNHIAKDAPGDAERAYRLSIRLRPDANLAHAGLALLLEQMGRKRDATDEALTALQVLDLFAAATADRTPTTEDIYPFRSPANLRQALVHLTLGRT